LVSLRHGLEQMDTLRTGRMPLKLNQRNRFDCPGHRLAGTARYRSALTRDLEVDCALLCQCAQAGVG
jgi:hypothetical protein